MSLERLGDRVVDRITVEGMIFSQLSHLAYPYLLSIKVLFSRIDSNQQQPAAGMFIEKYVLYIDDAPGWWQIAAGNAANISSKVKLPFEKALQFLELAQRQNNLPGLPIPDLNIPGVRGKEIFPV